MNEIKTFNHPLFGSVEIIYCDGSPWFGATQTAATLGYSNPRDAINRHCRMDGVVNHDVTDSLGRTQSMKFINEGNLYRLITKSKLPLAEKFEIWIFEEVIPSIRKHGAYMTPETLEKTMQDPDFLIGILNGLKDEQEARKKLEIQIEKDKSKVIFAESLETSQDCILIANLAKLLKQNGIDTGEKRLYRWLRENGYLGKVGEHYNMPTQRSMEMRLFEVKTRTINNPGEDTRISKTTVVTGRGQMYFMNKFTHKSA